jgi:hypothetical protein
VSPKAITLRATMRAVTLNATGCDIRKGGFAGVSAEPSSVTLKFAGPHGPIRVDAGTRLPAGFVPVGNDWEAARYEVTIRRLRKAPKKRPS